MKMPCMIEKCRPPVRIDIPRQRPPNEAWRTAVRASADRKARSVNRKIAGSQIAASTNGGQGMLASKLLSEKAQAPTKAEKRLRRSSRSRLKVKHRQSRWLHAKIS